MNPAPRPSPSRRSLFLFVFLFVGLLGGLAGAADGDNAAKEAAAFDWRAFLAPFHTVTLHLPIGFITIVVILEIYHWLKPSEPIRRAIGLILWISALSAIQVTVFGLFRASGGGYEPVTLENHENWGIAVSVATVVLALVHAFAYRPAEAPRKALAAGYRLMLIGDLVLLTIAGHYGGNLTHGSKYLTEGAPEWAKKWLEEHEGAAPKGGESSGAAAGGVYAATIQPVFEKKCHSCHGPEKQKGEYRMDTAEGLFKAGDSEIEPIVANSPMESYLVELITLPADDDDVMPPEGKEALTPDETMAIIRWIWDGAKLD